MQIDIREITCGVAFLVMAGLFALGTVELPMGSAIRMGPGYFPLLLAIIMGVLGLIILIKGFKHEPHDFGAIPWRGLLFILAGPIVFGLTVRGLGLVPAVALTGAIAAMASAKMTWKLLVLVVVCLTIFCVLVFSYGLGLPYARFGPWIAPFIPGV